MSRRQFLIAGLAGAAIGAYPGIASARAIEELTPSAALALPTVKPIWSHKAYEAFGVCAHPNFGNTTYQYTSQWMAALAETGASYFRGMYSQGINATATTTSRARGYGIKWGMTVAPNLSTTDTELVNRIRHIGANAADVCRYVEGINEPNHSRSGGAVPTDWIRRTVAKQRVIWQAVRSDPRLAHVKVLGPSLQAVEATESDYKALGDAGLAQYMTHAALHRYPGGRYPNHLIDERLTWIARHWGGRPTWITETGYTNALATPSGHNPVPEDVSACYAPSALLEAVDRGCQVCWYELLDDPDPGAKDNIESNFGMFATISGMAPPWRAKPVVSVMKSFLSRLKDPGPAYDPPRIGLSVVSNVGDVRSTVMAKRNGSVTLFLRRATNCWDPNRQTRLTVPTIPVIVTTAKGTQTISISHGVRAVTL